MAAPVAAGAAALYLSKYPEASNAEVKLRLLQTGRGIFGSDALAHGGTAGWKCLDVAAFLR